MAVLTGVRSSAYRVPTETPEADGTFAWDATTLVLVHATAAGCTGTGWTYTHHAAAELINSALAPVVTGRDCDAVPAANEAMRRALRNIGLPGLGAMAVSAVDIALWDLKARLHDLPLHRLLGAAADDVPIYGSGGFTTFDDDQLRTQLEGWTRTGIPRVKIKVGERWGTNQARDLARVRLTRDVIGDHAELYVDANGGYTRTQAVRFMRTADEYGVTWLEEPVSSEDTEGLAVIRDAVDADVAAGEYAATPADFTRLLPVVDVLQADVTRCGGITGWLRAAAIAHAAGLPVSTHCAPHAHLAAALAVPNLRHLEWFSDHSRIESMLFDGTTTPQQGRLRPTDAPGHGLTWKTTDASQFAVR
jgi:L-alanine-DL-glutamate epimerase-like enolase superfamily enzyme